MTHWLLSLDFDYLWSYGVQVLRLPENFIDRFGFPEFVLLRERYIEEQDYWPAQIVAKIHNVNRGKDDKPLDPRDLMRTKRPKETKKSLVNPNAFSKLALFAKAHNAFLDQANRNAKPRAGGVR